MSSNIPISAGHPYPLGASCDAYGVNFAVFSQHATRVSLCLFDAAGNERLLIDLPENTGHVWHGYFPGMRPGQHYGFRAHGPYDPEQGHRFNPHKLLIDPYARQLTGQPVWNDALFGYTIGDPKGDLSFDKRDSAPYVPRSVVVDPTFDWGDDKPPRTSLCDTVIYEAHVKGMTAGRKDIPHRGTFAGMAADPILDHLTKLGVTAVELMPVQAFLNEKFLLDKGLTNYWGYMTHGFFAPDPRYLSSGNIAEFQEMVARFHSAGIEVILDVVYNHTAEGSERGPTLSFRGLDNAGYYRLADDRRFYVNDAGCGNVLNLDQPYVLRMVMDSLRYWVEVMHVDGFRFDLATTLGRTGGSFDRNGPFLTAVRQDPVLNRVKMIAEPWDVGHGGYQLGSFPALFAEWNDKYRDRVKRFWRGDTGMIARLARGISGTAIRFDHDGRAATSSINFLTAHDGFTLLDTVSYNAKHNEANGEDNRDGHSQNFSDNCGVEGPTDDPDVIAARALRRRNMLATLMLSQGTPMILAGDELGNSQAGNNNAYCQDNPIGWIDWDTPDNDFLSFCQKVIAFRKDHPILRQRRFLHARSRLVDGEPDIVWRRADGQQMQDGDWNDPALRLLAAELRMASGTPEYAPREGSIYAVFNIGGDTAITLPALPLGQCWQRQLDTATTPVAPSDGATRPVQGNSVVAFVLEPTNDT